MVDYYGHVENNIFDSFMYTNNNKVVCFLIILTSNLKKTSKQIPTPVFGST